MEPLTEEVVTNCKKLLESVLYLDDADVVTYNAVINILVYNLEAVDDFEEYQEVCHSICHNMILLFGKAPQRMDHLLRLYYRLADRTVRWERQLFDQQFDETSYPELLDALAIHCGDFAHSKKCNYGGWVEQCLRYPELHALPPGGTDPEDGSKLVFSQEEVDTDFQRVKDAVNFQAEQQNAGVIGGAILGRHAALMAGGACESEGVRWGFVDDLGIEKCLAKTREPYSPTWDTSDSIALLLRVRGMAKSLFSKPGVSSDELIQKKTRWIALLKRWLWDENFNVGNDRLVKHHVMVSRSNGPL